jgi:hypothetical protein
LDRSARSIGCLGLFALQACANWVEESSRFYAITSLPDNRYYNVMAMSVSSPEKESTGTDLKFATQSGADEVGLAAEKLSAAAPPLGELTCPHCPRHRRRGCPGWPAARWRQPPAIRYTSG